MHNKPPAPSDKSSPQSSTSLEDAFFDQNVLSKTLSCRKCRKGKMLPSIEEGGLEYTDNFVCSHCQYQDTIPTRGLLFGQAFTGLSGISICIYLLIIHLSQLFKGIQHDNLHNAFKDSGLVLISGIFLAGFIFVLFKAREGFQHRLKYKNDTQK